MMELRLIEIQNQLFKFEALPNDFDYHGYFDYPSDINWITEQIESGNNAAWFTAKLTLLVKDPESINMIELGSEYLGGCSYQSFDSFINEPDGYLQDMAQTLINNCNQNNKAGK